MTMMDIITKILLFFLVFYGAIMLTALFSKKIREVQERKKKDRSPLSDKDKKDNSPKL
jgi:hypothetical protein